MELINNPFIAPYDALEKQILKAFEPIPPVDATQSASQVDYVMVDEFDKVIFGRYRKCPIPNCGCGGWEEPYDETLDRFRDYDEHHQSYFVYHNTLDGLLRLKEFLASDIEAEESYTKWLMEN